jgi:hypothetical protein
MQNVLHASDATEAGRSIVFLSTLHALCHRAGPLYRVEMRGKKLYFLKTGSQFDAAHPGSLGRTRMESSPAAPAKPFPRRAFILGGLGIIVGSLALFVIMMKAAGIVHTGPIFIMVGGIVMVIMGVVSPSRPYAEPGTDPDLAVGSHPHNFAIPISGIQRAALTLPKRADQAARLELALDTGKKFKCSIKSEADLASAKRWLIPALGARASMS